jgi:cell division protein FtsI/penicillin-binding protein 2
MRKRRLQHLILALAFVQAILAARMIQLQVVEHETWAERARRSRLEKRTIPAERGRIFDAEGIVLAEDRRSFDLMLEYRAFRRGQAIAQLFELCLLLGEPCEGLQVAARDAERLVEQALAWTPAQFSGLGSRGQGDALYYLRRLSGFGRSRANQLEQWARDSSLPFGRAFPEAGPAMRLGLAESRSRLRDLERLLGLDLQDPLLERLELERQGLERRIRQQAVRSAAAEALGWGAWEVKARLAANRAPAGESAERQWRVDRYFALQDLALRWRWTHSEEELAALVAPAGEDTPSAEQLGALLAQVEAYAEEDVAGLRRELVARVHRDRVARLVRGVDFEIVDRIGQDPEGFAGLQVELAADRLYPSDYVPQLIGNVRMTNDEDIDRYHEQRRVLQELAGKMVRTPEEEESYRSLRRDFLRNTMRPGDVRGLDGLEAAFEEVLRGERGYLRELAGAEDEGRPRELEFVAPRAGKDLRISISARLNSLAEQAIDQAYAIARETHTEAQPGTLERLRQPRVGFAIIDLRDGTVPVLATLPSYTRDEVRTEYEILVADRQNAVFRHRALGGNAEGWQVPYPGSTFKPLIALLALERDAAAWDREIHCSNAWLPPGQQASERVRPLKCLNHSARTLNMHEALKLSCNTYFYTLGYELGWQAIWKRARELGFGAPTGIEVVESERIVLEEQDREGDYDDGVRFRPVGPNASLESGANFLGTRHSAFNGFTLPRFGIGQVSVHASPLQMARFYGWIATGELLTPRLVLESGGGAPALPEPTQIRLDPGSQRQVMGALRAVTEDPTGTAYDDRYRLDLFRVAGKTGTAQPSNRHATHAWFAGYFPWDEPRWAFAVLCENVQLHGGEIANIVVHQFLSSEEARAYFDLGQD